MIRSLVSRSWRIALLWGLLSLASAATLAASGLGAAPDRNARLPASGGTNGTAARLVSPGGQYWLTVQTDGNLVLYRGDCAKSPHAGCAVWSSRSAGPVGDYFLALQNDGNLVVYRGRVAADAPPGAEGSAQPVWNSQTSRQRGHYLLTVEEDGNLVLWSGNAPNARQAVVWSIKPVATPPTHATAPAAAPTQEAQPAAGPVNLNGSWQNNLLHIWQEGDQVLITASWRRAGGEWVIWRAEGRLQGRFMDLPVRYSRMTAGDPAPYRGEFTVSADGQVIQARYMQNGRVVDEQTYRRDR
jgi:hypothetical protein